MTMPSAKMCQEWIAYLEKQKETSHISEMCKENANSFTDEDARIRKELKEAFAAYDIESTWNGIPIRSIFSWLEKQAKSERVIKAARRVLNNWLDGTDYPDVSGDFVELEYAIRKYDGEEKQKEQKPAQAVDEKEYIRTIKSIISDFIRDKKPENLAYYQRIYDWLDGRHVPFSCGHENGQPADPVFSKQEYESHPIISTDTTSVKPVEFDGKTLLYTADKSYQIGFRDGVASVKPAECSKATINGQPIPTENHSVDIPLAEWSEEDGKTINDACCWIAEYAGYLMDKNYGKASMLMGLTDKLKSLRPQPSNPP